jgi:Effector Associated Constant Component 1
MPHLTLTVESGPGSDQQESAELTSRLRQLILQSDVDRVDYLRDGPVPAGAKGDAITLTSLAVTLAPIALTGLITTLQSWLSRHERATVTVESGGEKLTITGSPSHDQQQTVAAFLNRHQP